MTEEEKGMTEEETVRWHHQLDANLSKLLEMKDRGIWCAAVLGVAKRQTRLSD